MRIKEHSKAAVYCLMACVAGSLFFSMANQAEAQIIYTVTGFANNLGPDDNLLSPQVGLEETYTAVFEIDETAVDTNSSTERGFFPNAILSSSITFSGGYTSTVDFAGGTVQVRPSGSISFDPPRPAPDGPGPFTNKGAFLLFSSDSFESDALFSEPQEISNLPGSLWSLEEPDGLIVSGAVPSSEDTEFPPEAAKTLSVTLPPTVLGDCNLDGSVNFLDISPFVSILSSGGEYLEEADMNQSGDINFLDIQPFVNVLLGRPIGSPYSS